jgi:hypothetical protein
MKIRKRTSRKSLSNSHIFPESGKNWALRGIFALFEVPGDSPGDSPGDLRGKIQVGVGGFWEEKVRK